MSSCARAVVALTLGDPAGIGPELIARLLAEPETTKQANVVLVGDPWLWEEGKRVARREVATLAVSSLADVRGRQDTSRPAFLAVHTIAREDVHVGRAEAPGGRSVLQVLDRCLDAARAGRVDAICFAPLSKQAMKQSGMHHEDELHHFAEYLGVRGYVSEFNTLDGLWTSRISSHVPLKDVTRYVTEQRITEAAELIYRTLLASGVAAPRVAVAGLNPHNGEGGTCGREEIDVIAPAVRTLQTQRWPTPDPFHGPFPADTLFLRARAGEFQAVVTMYHDQGQIALKLLGFSRGVTVHGGLPFPVTTPAHGTAYDIAGLGRANVEATRQAFLMACRMGAAHAAR